MAGHVPHYRKRKLGYRSWGRTVPIWGTSIRCSCGWRWETNEGRREAVRIWRDHLQQATVGRFGFGPARVG